MEKGRVVSLRCLIKQKLLTQRQKKECSHLFWIYKRLRLYVLCVFKRARARACVCVCVRVCARALEE